jgi:hypothetical protein
VLAVENALLFRVMANKAFTIGVGLTRSGPNEGDLLALRRARSEQKFVEKFAEKFAAETAPSRRASASGG